METNKIESESVMGLIGFIDVCTALQARFENGVAVNLMRHVFAGGVRFQAMKAWSRYEPGDPALESKKVDFRNFASRAYQAAALRSFLNGADHKLYIDSQGDYFAVVGGAL